MISTPGGIDVLAEAKRLAAHDASHPGDHRPDAQRLLDERVEVGLLTRLRPLEHGGIVEQQIEGPGQSGGGGLVAGQKQRHELVADLAVAEALAVLVLGQQERGEDVVAIGQVRLGPPPGDLGVEDLVDGPLAGLIRGIATVPEGRRIFPELTVRENLKVGAYHRRKAFGGDSEFDFAFEMFPRLKERTQQLGGTLSGGEQQMLAIARALMTKPRLLLLDEPSMGLAPILIEAVFGTIERLAREGMTVLLVEQNAEAALGIASRAYIMERGTIVLGGVAAEIAGDPRVQQSYLGVT